MMSGPTTAVVRPAETVCSRTTWAVVPKADSELSPLTVSASGGRGAAPVDGDGGRAVAATEDHADLVARGVDGCGAVKSGLRRRDGGDHVPGHRAVPAVVPVGGVGRSPGVGE